MNTPPTLTAPASAAGLDLSDAARAPLGRLAKVELRKLVDTRSGRWLLIIQSLLILVGSAIVTIAVTVQVEPIGFMDFTNVAGTIMSLLLPVMGILAITSEWSQRTNLSTFTLEPRRQRIVAAKLLATVTAAAASVVVAVLIGYAASAAAAILGVDVDWTTDGAQLTAFALLQVVGLLVGFAFGTLLLNTPAAIVCFFAYFTLVPAVLAIAAEAIGWFADVRPWVDFTDAQLALSEDGFGAVDWPQFVVSGTLWLVLPLAAGVVRMLRAEVK